MTRAEKHVFPPDLAEDAVKLVIQQAEALSIEMARAPGRRTRATACTVRYGPLREQALIVPKPA